jgi:hypothetical protein
LQQNLTILYHPQRHPEAHSRLIELLSDAGVTIKEYSRVSHPTEMQTLVKDGYGFALIREGTLLDESLTTRRTFRVDWAVDTAVIYHRHPHLKTIPVTLRKLRRSNEKESHKNNISAGVQRFSQPG